MIFLYSVREWSLKSSILPLLNGILGITIRKVSKRGGKLLAYCLSLTYAHKTCDRSVNVN